MNPLNPLHISHSVNHGDGGIAFAVSDLLAAQQKKGVYSRWLTADQFDAWRRDQSIYQSILNCHPNIIHFHGLWRSHTRIASKLGSSGFATLIAPHGMLDAWAMAHASWKKELVWQLWEKQSLGSASCLHAVSQAEAQSIRARLPGLPIAVIPNGVNCSSSQTQDLPNPPWHGLIPSDQHVLLFLGRFHQKKGLEPLMAAWQSVLDTARKKSWWLFCAGFGDDGKFQNQLANFPIERCIVSGPLFGADKNSAFFHASSFILPSYSEGLPVAALEAMSFSLPCLLSTACNIPEAFSCNAAIRAEPEISELIPALKTLFNNYDSDFIDMGKNSRRLVEDKFNWNTIASTTAEVYSWMLGNSNPPDCVLL